MEKTWIIAEQLKNNSFCIIKAVQSGQEPTDEYRKGVIEAFEAYKDRKIPNNVVCLFKPLDEEASSMLAEAAQDNLLTVFKQLKSAGRTSCNDIVSIQRSAWCHINGINVLEYSFQNRGGEKSKYMKIVGNPDFQKFRAEKCETNN